MAATWVPGPIQQERGEVYEITYSTAQTSQFSSPSGLASLVDQPLSWLPTVAEKLRELIRLPWGWDSYRARQISAHAAKTVMNLLRRVMQDCTPVPSIVPMSQGGIQLEWHLRGMNIEVTVPVTGSAIEVWWGDIRSGEEREFTIEDDPATLRDLLAALTRRG